MPEKTITTAAGCRAAPCGRCASACCGGGRPRVRGDEREQRVQRGGQVVDRRRERAEAPTRIEQVRERAEQVAEQTAARELARGRIDAHVDQARPHPEAEEIERD